MVTPSSGSTTARRASRTAPAGEPEEGAPASDGASGGVTERLLGRE